MSGEVRVKITDEIRDLVKRGVEIASSKSEFTKILGFYGSSPTVINRILDGRQKTICRWQVERVKKFLDGK